MDRRKAIAVVFNYNENWMGGTYYIYSVIDSLNTLPDEIKPDVTILTKSEQDFQALKTSTRYPRLRFKEVDLIPSLSKRAVNKLSVRLFKRPFLGSYVKDEFDFVFPFRDVIYLDKIPSNKRVYWIPDFQENYLPELFSEEEIIKRKQRQIIYAVKNVNLVFSSKDACDDFRVLYPFSKNKTSILRFAVTVPELNREQASSVLSKFGINGSFFLAPNQFWIHKNHRIVIEAVQLLKSRYPDIRVVFTGKEFDPRDSEHPAKLKGMVEQLGLKENVRFLGFIERSDMYALMSEADAVIQPSLFEGWSTVVEDAKALNKFVIASDLKVHREQLSVNSTFFDPYSALDLSYKLASFLDSKPSLKQIQYSDSRAQFANDFINLL